jgi:muconate cycloisomerase
MPIDKAELYALHIPFRMEFTHSRMKRAASDSLVLELSAGATRGYGEAVVRDYVSGALGRGEILEEASRIASKMLEPLVSAELTAERLAEWNAALDPDDVELPILCAVETALFDLLCKQENTDIYALLERKPVRQTLTYGGILPILSLGAAKSLLIRYRDYDIRNLRIKIGSEFDYNREILSLARSVLGENFDLRVDVNGAWEIEEASEHLAVLENFGITTVEEPFGRSRENIGRSKEVLQSPGFTFVADESVLSAADLEYIVESDTYSMINIRLSKNGGLLRSLEIDKMATRHDIAAQLGCLVGETGILSAAGRVAASLMENPVYVDGSFDEYLLSENITAANLTFGRGGLAGVIRGEGIGFTVDEKALERLSNERSSCI